MARLDLHRVGDTLVVDVQHDLLDRLPTRVVAPVLPPERAGRPVRDLHPTVELDGRPHVIAVQLLAAVPARELGPAVGSLDAAHDAITRSVGILLLTGV